MRILLLGEFSNLHATLAEGLRRRGHEVLVVSDGTYIYDYKRDISLDRRGNGRWSAIRYLAKLLVTLPRLRGFDIVQLINPDCFALKAERQFALYRYLRRHNKVVVLGAFGNDWQWVECGLNRRLFRYGDFNVGDRLRTNAYTQQVVNEWLHSKKGELSRYIANDCDALVTCLYEYQLAYHDDYPQKTRFIPLPIVPKAIDPATLERTAPYPVRFFLGIKRILMEFRGTDIFYDALQRIKADYPDKCEVTVVEDLPFAEYEKRMNGQDFILDQAYSYTPAMNALEAMSKGVVCIGGGEPENYEIIDETELRPIINILPDREHVYQALSDIIAHPEQIVRLKKESIQYIERHHDYVKVAAQYEELYQRLLSGAGL
jgi:glycosyltransferase involved in cell wall biosynthesis